MKTGKIKYSNERIGPIKMVPDFLPPPDQLILKDDTVKVTLALTKSSLDFFKKAAKSQHTQYQKMIRSLLDQYASHFK